MISLTGLEGVTGKEIYDSVFWTLYIRYPTKLLFVYYTRFVGRPTQDHVGGSREGEGRGVRPGGINRTTTEGQTSRVMFGIMKVSK